MSQPFDAEGETALPGQEGDPLPEDAETMVLGEEATAVLGEDEQDEESADAADRAPVDPLDHDAGH